MRHNKSEVYLHIVWTTEGRQPLLDERCERSVHRCIESAAAKLGCLVLALDGMLDHVHCVVRLPTRLSIAALVKQVKGVSSAMVNAGGGLDRSFRWQESYGVFSVSRSHLSKVIAYVRNHEASSRRPTALGRLGRAGPADGLTPDPRPQDARRLRPRARGFQPLVPPGVPPRGKDGGPCWPGGRDPALKMPG